MGNVTTGKGYGQTRKTKASAKREADRWNASGHGAPYTHNGVRETITAEAEEVEGGWACAYLTTREEV